MRSVVRVLAVLSLALVMVVISCRKEGEAKSKVAQVAQDTMLLHDLAEANKNTAAAASSDNSLTTVRTSTDGSAPLASDASPTPANRVLQRPVTSEQPVTPAANTERLTPPTRANDAPHPTTVPLSRSPANSVATSSSGDPCDTPSMTEQRYCLNRSIVTNDADLNSIYQDLLSQARKSGGSDLEERFRQSQREWVNQRDSDCRAQTPVESGKLWARALGRCLANYSSRRTEELRRNLNNLRGQ